MPQTQPRQGGVFAPPLTDAKLAAYKELAAQAPPQARDAMESLIKCVETWWELPDSTRDGTPHASGVGVMIPLEEDHAAALDDHIPWRDELNSYAARFDALDADAARRNGENASQWQAAVQEDLLTKEFPHEHERRFFGRTKAHRAVLTALEPLGVNVQSVADKVLNAIIGVLFPGTSTSSLRDAEAKLKRVGDALRKAISGKYYENIPRPKREPTPTRDAAHHLLWHVNELDLGREPITSDKL
jgi:3-oxoacyl-(acyl-carrier-protein) synthase